MSKACYRGGPKVRNSGRPKPEAKTVGVPPPGGNFKMSPGRNSAICLGYKEIARTVKGQAPRYS